MSKQVPKIILEKGREKSCLQLHHWVFSGAIKETKGSPKEGDLVEVCSYRGDSLGLGHFGEKSIAVRMISFSNATINERDMLSSAINTAYNLRINASIPSAATNAYRLVHSEGDRIPGLTIDVYDDTVVIQAHSAAMYRLQEALCDIIKEIIPKTRCIILREGRSLNSANSKSQIIYGNEPSEVILENDIPLRVDLICGQKTGFFIDQRENRNFLGSIAKDKRILNLFSYSGGFSIYALKQGALEVSSVDASDEALKLLEENLQLNFPDGLRDQKHQSIKSDIKKYLPEEKNSYDIVILDPPALVKHQKDFRQGISSYEFFHTHALRRTNSGGFLLSFSCSQFVTAEDLLRVAIKTSLKEGRYLQVVKPLFQASCHPVNPYHPESSYLKGFVFRVL